MRIIPAVCQKIEEIVGLDDYQTVRFRAVPDDGEGSPEKVRSRIRMYLKIIERHCDFAQYTNVTGAAEGGLDEVVFVKNEVVSDIEKKMRVFKQAYERRGPRALRKTVAP